MIGFSFALLYGIYAAAETAGGFSVRRFCVNMAKLTKRCYYVNKTEKGGDRMAQRGRKSKYNDYVKPRLSDVKKWAAAGATDQEICIALGVSVSSFCEYKNKFPELSEALRVGRQTVILEIKAALYKKAVGFKYEEKVGRMKGDDLQTEVYERYSPPDATACAMLLRNYSDEWRDKDLQTTDFRRQEIAIKKALAESNNFDVTIK